MTPAGTTSATAHGRHPAAPLAAASGAVVVWGVAPLFVRAMGASGITVAAYRLVLAVPVMFVILALQGGRVTWPILRSAAPAGVLFAMNIGFGFSSFQRTSIANATLLGALSPLLVLVASRRLFGERLRAVDYGWFAVASAGTLLVVLSAGGGQGARHSYTGDFLALAGAVAWTVYFLYVKQRRLDGVPAFAFMTAVITCGAIAFTPFALLASRDLGAVRGLDFVWLAGMIVLPGATGHGLMTWATRYINVNVTSLMTLAGPVVSILGARVFFGERLATGQVVGGAAVLAAIMLVLIGHRPRQLAPQPLEAE